MEQNAQNTLNWKEIGQRFKGVRKSHNLSQEEIGKLSNQLRQAITRYENGLQPASINYALFLRNECGASFDWLYDGVETLRAETDKSQKKSFDPHAIGNRLKEIRLKMELTQKEFGLLIGLSSVGVGNIENGYRKPEIKTALKIKKALNKPLDWIYFGDTCIPTKGGNNRHITIPSIPLKLVKKTLKDEVMHHIKMLDTNELAVLATRLRMEKGVNVINENSTHNKPHNTFSSESKPKSSE